MLKKIFKNIIVYIITLEAKLILRKYKPKVIAVTGSVGKTSTKDAIFTVLSKFKKVRKSQKSFNSEIGLPLTILGCENAWSSPVAWFKNILKGFYFILVKQNYPEYLVLEVGVGKPGDIKKNVLPWLKTDVVIITHFPDKPVHIEYFGSVEKVIEEKSALAYTLKKDGVLILNHDDEKVYNLHSKVKVKTVSYGLHENSTYQCLYPNYSYKKEGDYNIPSGVNFKLKYNGNTFPVSLPNIVSLDHIGHVMSAIACAFEIGIDLLNAINEVSNHHLPPGRLNLIKGINDSFVIDDTYNSSPFATEAALKILKDIEGKRKIAVLGDMLELGKFTEDEHRNVGKKVSSICNILVTIGPRAKFIAEEAILNGLNKKDVHIFDNSINASKFVEEIIEKGDIVLAKGSQGARVEKVVEAIMLDKANAKNLLCRQDKEWKNR